MLTIGPYSLAGRALLAPMAGVTDAPLRRLCAHYGAALTTSEMVTADTSLWESEKSRLRLPAAESVLEENNYYSLSTLPVSIQIAGSDPEQLAHAAQAAVAQGAAIVDINMGCPAKKVCKKLAGSALLKDEKLVSDILHTVVNSVAVPVTLKTRTGWDEQNKNGLRIAVLAQEAGIQALTIHGRTRACRFNGKAEYQSIKDIVDAVDIPVIANGDIDSAEKARSVLNDTGAAGVMIGRGALGQPWIFEQVNDCLEKNRYQTISLERQCFTLVEHVRGLHLFYGETKGVRIARKHVAWYLDKWQQQPELNEKLRNNNDKQQFNRLEEQSAQIDFIYQVCKRLSQGHITPELKNEELAA